METSTTTILAIAGDAAIEAAICKAIPSSNYQVIFERSGYDAVNTAKKVKPDVILCDFDLPDMAARDILEEVGNHGLLTLCPFIFLIGDEWDKKSSTLMDTDMDAIIRHSIIEEELPAVIRQAKEAKINHLESLNQAQHEFNECFAENFEDKYSEEATKKRLLIIQKLFPLIKLGRMSLNAGIEILDEAVAELDEKIMDANRFINMGRCIERNHQVIGIPIQKIWLIDDDATQNLLNRIILKQSNPNWHISEFNDANRAFQALSSRKPDLVFLDINMPGMSGFEFLKKLKVNKIKLNVIMLSSSVSMDEIKKSFDYDQVVNYLTKPMEREKVERLLKSVMQ